MAIWTVSTSSGTRRIGKSNIIDFSDRSIGDPALDFGGLHAYGHEFAERVLEHYGGPGDEGTLRRAQMYFRRTALETMADSLQGYPCTFEEGYAEFTERFELYPPQPRPARRSSTGRSSSA